MGSRSKFKCGESGLVRIGGPPLKRVIREGFSEEEVSTSEANGAGVGEWQEGDRKVRLAGAGAGRLGRLREALAFYSKSRADKLPLAGQIWSSICFDK